MNSTTVEWPERGRIMKKLLVVSVVTLAAVAMGCSNAKLVAEKDQQIASLQEDISALEADLATQRQMNEELEQKLSGFKEKEKVWIEEKDGLTHITIDGEVTFNTGSTRIKPTGKDILDKIWDVVGQYPDRNILIEGHTDNVPIAERFQYRYKSNWELSSARAHQVLHYVRSQFGVDPKRIAAVGYGEYRPIADNDTEEGRARNRRVVITIGGQLSRTEPLP
jgi:chemotaxis protein MotB